MDKDRNITGDDRTIFLKDGGLYARINNETIGKDAAGVSDGKWHLVSHVFDKDG